MRCIAIKASSNKSKVSNDITLRYSIRKNLKKIKINTYDKLVKCSSFVENCYSILCKPIHGWESGSVRKEKERRSVHNSSSRCSIMCFTNCGSFSTARRISLRTLPFSPISLKLQAEVKELLTHFVY